MSIDKLTLILNGLTIQEIREVLAKVREIEQRHPEDLIFVYIRGLEDKSVEETLQILKKVFPEK